ncbi:hypothetical protein C8F01DRAFT_538923 [Mycena amicta]|nr:hypothetical protein C8F01DRAFT_538923 [Mycena amicta]
MSFPFASLPVELALRIMSYAVGCGQGTYRSLLLTNRRIYDWIRIEMLPNVPVALTSQDQMRAFDYYLQKRGPEVIPRIRALWLSPVHDLCASIIKRCTYIRALACHSSVLTTVFRGTELRHVHCVALTLFQFRINSDPTPPAFHRFLNQLHQIHFIGALDHHFRSSTSVIPKLENLRRVSIAMGSYPVLTPELFGNLIQSPKLEQVVITSHLHGEAHQNLAAQAPAIDHRLSVVHRRRRWKELNMWQEGVQDADRFWNQAAAEKELPPPPRHVAPRTLPSFLKSRRRNLRP